MMSMMTSKKKLRGKDSKYEIDTRGHGGQKVQKQQLLNQFLLLKFSSK